MEIFIEKQTNHIVLQSVPITVPANHYAPTYC